MELLITLAIAAIVLGIGITSFSAWAGNTQSREVASSLKSSLTFARGQAIKHGGWVSVCGSADGSSCTSSYADGWVVFLDLDRDSSLTPADSVLKWFEQEHGRVELEVTDAGGATPLVFNYRGYPSRSITVKSTRGDFERKFMLHLTGRLEKQ